MTHSTLKAQFTQRGLIRDIDRVSSGSPADLVLRPSHDVAGVRVIDATLALVRRGLTMLQGKRAVEAMLERGETTVSVPIVESLTALAGDLRAAGIGVTTFATAAVDVKALRDTLRMTQDQFARRFNLDVDTVRNWEQGRNVPDRASANYLRVIARMPADAAAAQEERVE
jgi:DNA-binding XRE family transcriptional regulator